MYVFNVAPLLRVEGITRYTIPNGELLCQYQEIFEHPSLTGLIVTQTAAYMVQTISSHYYNHHGNISGA